LSLSPAWVQDELFAFDYLEKVLSLGEVDDNSDGCFENPFDESPRTTRGGLKVTGLCLYFFFDVFLSIPELSLPVDKVTNSPAIVSQLLVWD